MGYSRLFRVAGLILDPKNVLYWLNGWYYTILDVIFRFLDHENIGLDTNFIMIGVEMTDLSLFQVFGIMAARLPLT